MVSAGRHDTRNMAELQLYDKLLTLPLFQGMSKDELSHVVAHIKLGFEKFAAQETLVQAGDSCDHLTFVLNGEVEVHVTADDQGYELTESLPSPMVIQPQHLFGLVQRHSRTFTAHTDCSTLQLRKEEVGKLIHQSAIFRINLLNLLSTQSQRLLHRPWQPVPPSLASRIASFLASHCLQPTGEKHFKIKMTQLAEELNDSRLDISHALNHLQKQGLLILSRGKIDVPDMEKLLLDTDGSL